MVVLVIILRVCLGMIIDVCDVLLCVFYGEKIEDVRLEKNGFLRFV